jgi:ABC-2 type transport system ATP-binding protein
VGVLVDGHLLAVATPAELRRRALGGDVIRVRSTKPLDAPSRRVLGALPPVRDVRPTDLGAEVLDVVVDEAGAAMAPLVSWFGANAGDVESIEPHLPPWDDVFVVLVERHRSATG